MAYTSHKTLSQRFTGLAFVVGFHVVVVYMLATGLGGQVVKVAETILETKVVEEVKEVEDEPPPPPPDLKEPPPFIPPPEVSIAQEVSAAPTTAIKTVQSKVAAPPAPAADVIVMPKQNKRRPNTIPNYPPTSRRLGETGVVTLQIYVNEEGKVVEAKVAKSSGFERLDQAAVKHVKRAWRFIPGTKNGKVFGTWMTVPVRFVLK
jgi:protein TonB